MDSLTKGKECPVCGRSRNEKYTPFCSKKCADIDLGRWLKGTYVIHTDEKPQDSDLKALTNETD